MVGLLRPLYDAFDFGASRTGIESHLVDRIEHIQELTERYSDSLSVQEDRLEDAISGMVEYVEDMVDHYADEIDLDPDTSKAQVPIVESFRDHVSRVLQNPVEPFYDEYIAAMDQLDTEAENAAAIAAQRNLEGASSFLALGVIGLVMLGGVLLLLVFKVEQSLRQYAGHATQTAKGTNLTPETLADKQDTETHPEM